MILQFGYAAVTTRAVSAQGFGTYGVALTVGAFVSLLANGGLGQAAGRMTELASARTRGLSAYGSMLGIVGAIALFLTADFWAAIWQTPEAAGPVRWMSLMALTGPLFGLVTGMMRRLGSFRQLAILVFVCNIVGMLIGAFAVSIWRTPSSLLISPIIAQSAVVLVGFVLYTRLLVGRWNFAEALHDLSFSWKLTAARLLSYVSGNAGKYGVTVSLGASTLGVWNRTDVLTSVPFNQLQTAMVQAVYPEFRHDISSPKRAYNTWPDLLGLVAWVALPLGALVAVVVPSLVPILFGPGWEGVAALVPVLAMAAAVQMIVIILGSAIEALGRFKLIWATQAALVIIQVAAAGITVATKDWTPVLVTIFLAFGVQHVFHIVFCSRTGYLNVSRLLRHYGSAVAAMLVIAAASAASVWLLHEAPLPWGISIVTTAVLLSTWALWRLREKLPPFRIAREYGVF
ncbi:hypothetical protein GY21_15875 [Cryobacterium roopkundense]|uniref:Polysaccharide biosynthesis protein C-terminal domain-containing protein n=1 Tax=Cryobacterium roopkundense TaxID=1001240 RepID=A0A099J4A9_9MICO|nr:hypothetical protein GY21_15875 [Cryobacterium roopkundense]